MRHPFQTSLTCVALLLGTHLAHAANVCPAPQSITAKASLDKNGKPEQMGVDLSAAGADGKAWTGEDPRSTKKDIEEALKNATFKEAFVLRSASTVVCDYTLGDGDMVRMSLGTAQPVKVSGPAWKPVASGPASQQCTGTPNDCTFD